MTIGLRISVEDQKDVKVVRIEGRLDATSAPALEKCLADLINKNGHKVLIEFSMLDYLSSAGMRLMLSVTKKSKASEGRVAFCSMGEDVMEIIKMAGFERLLPIYPNEEEALVALQ